LDPDRKPNPISWFLIFPWWGLIIAGLVEGVLSAKFHWLDLTVFELVLLWSFLQALWLRRSDRRSSAIIWYAGAEACELLAIAAEKLGAPRSTDAFWTLSMVLWLAAVFIFRYEMQRYFNGKDNVGLGLGPWMTLFYNTVYFQYHFNEIAAFKKRHPEQITPVAG